jgi:uncharacterized membrane protein (UPF0136 family)
VKSRPNLINKLINYKKINLDIAKHAELILIYVVFSHKEGIMIETKRGGGMSLYRRVGASLFVFFGIMSFTLFSNYVMPLVLIVLTPAMSLYYYLMWTRYLAQKQVFLFLLIPIVAIPLAFFVYKTNNDPKVILSMGPSMVMAVSLNLMIWGKRAVPPKRQEISA